MGLVPGDAEHVMVKAYGYTYAEFEWMTDEWNGGGASMTFDKILSHFHLHGAAARNDGAMSVRC
jgi:hypothetical protein